MNGRVKIAIALVAMIAAMLTQFVRPVFAQLVEENLPRKIQPGATPAIISETDEKNKSNGAQDETALLKEVRGIVFVQKQEQVRTSGYSATGIDVSRVKLLQNDRFKAQFTPFLGQPLTRKSLSLISETVTRYYRSIHRPFVSVTVPPQEVTHGAIQLLVIEFKLGKLTSNGNNWTPDSFLQDNIRIAPGKDIRSDILSEDLDWLNKNPFRTVSGIFQPGNGIGETDLNLRVKEQKPWQVYAGYSNTGTSSTGHDRYFLGANIANLPIIDHQLGYKFTTSRDFWNSPDAIFKNTPDLSYVSHAATYNVPLQWRHNFSLNGSHVTTKSKLTAPFTQEAKSSQIALGYAVPISFSNGLKAELSGGFEYKHQKTDLFFDGTFTSGTELNILQFIVGAKGIWSDKFGQTSLDMRVAISPGGIGDNNGTAAFIAATGNPLANPSYNYFYAKLNRQTKLPSQFYLSTDLKVQFSNTPLPGIEHLAMGGKETIRGFDELEASGDDGVIVSNELHFPGFRFVGSIANLGISDLLSPYVFVDYGHVRDGVTNESQTFLSTGAGASYQLSEYFSLSADFGVALRDGPITRKGDTKLRIQLTTSY